ncbi:hypothetical protein GCM10022223_11120 [Kineosporia mesophila]|uniref:Adhesin domain-containing protein n=1 Tax=Kineosporia mesophila TaxID=566012 RepID=A0ABP6Z7U0_9ACTN
MVAVVAIAVLAVLLVVHYTDERRGGDRSGAGHVDHTPTLAAAGQDEARLVVTGGMDRLTVTADDLGGDLVRARTPEGQRAVPVLQAPESGVVRLSTEGSDDTGGGGVDLAVRLSRDVRWDIEIDGGSSALALDLGQARVHSLDVTQGVASVDVRLPRPDGTLRARIGGGANAVRFLVPADVPAQVTFSAGVGQADLDGEHRDGLAAGTVLDVPVSNDSTDRVEVALDSGIGSFNFQHEN